MFSWVFTTLGSAVSAASGYLNTIVSNPNLILLWSAFIGVILFGFLTYRLFLPALRIGQSDSAARYAPRRFRK